jgi:hypothetical protein
VKDAVYYSEPTNDQYEIFWIWFPEEVFQWLDRLQEAPEFKDRVKRRLHWNVAQLVSLHRLDHLICRVVYFWVKTMLDGYIIEFFVENHQSFLKEEVVFYEGPRGRLLREIPLWMKILLVEEGMFHVPSGEMASVNPYA